MFDLCLSLKKSGRASKLSEIVTPVEGDTKASITPEPRAVVVAIFNLLPNATFPGLDAPNFSALFMGIYLLLE